MCAEKHLVGDLSAARYALVARLPTALIYGHALNYRTAKEIKAVLN